MHVTSFYSYKGGVGRTVCLLNVAWELALRGKRVALMDLDLEAPGLHRAHLLEGTKGSNMRPVGARQGLLHAFYNWMNRVDEQKGMSDPFDLPIVTGLGPGKRIALLPTGRSDDDEKVDDEYQNMLHRFNWGTFYHEPYFGGSFLEKVVELLDQQHYEHLLVDARTGLTDVRYVTTIHLPDLVVLVTNLTEQSLRGTREQIQRIDKINKECLQKNGSHHRRQDLEQTPIEKLIVASPVPLGEWEIRKQRLGGAKKLLRGCEIDVVVDHLPILAYHEDNQILDWKRDDPWAEDPERAGPAAAFADIAEAILRRAARSAENLVEAGERMFRGGRWREASAFFDAAVEKEKSADRANRATFWRAYVGRALAQLQGLEPANVENQLQAEAVLQSPSLSRLTQLADVWLAISWSYVIKENYAAAAKAAHGATELLKDEQRYDHQRLRAFAWYVEGDARAELGALELACKCLSEADDIYRTLPGVYAEQAMVLGRLANTLALRGEPTEAEKKLESARERLGQVFPDMEEQLGKRLWAGLREAEGEIKLAHDELAVAANAFIKVEEALRGIDTVGHLHVLSRLHHLNTRFGFGLPKTITDEFGKLFQRATDLRLPQVAVSVHLDQAMQATKNPAKMKEHIDAVRDLLKKTPIPDLLLRKDIVQVWGNLEEADSTLLDRDEHTATEYYELRYELALIRALAAHKGTKTEDWQRRTERACQSALRDGLSLWYDLLWIASGGTGSPERPPVADEAAVRDAVRQVLLPLGRESDWPEPLQDAFKRRYASLAVQET